MRRNALIIGPPSDSHTWNLFFLKLFLKEQNFSTQVLGGGIRYDEITDTIKKSSWDLILVSSLNGHFLHEAEDIINAIKRGLPSSSNTRIIAGGKLDTFDSSGAIIDKLFLKLGFDAAFFGSFQMESFTQYLECMPKPMTFSQAI